MINNITVKWSLILFGIVLFYYLFIPNKTILEASSKPNSDTLNKYIDIFIHEKEYRRTNKNIENMVYYLSWTNNTDIYVLNTKGNISFSDSTGILQSIEISIDSIPPISAIRSVLKVSYDSLVYNEKKIKMAKLNKLIVKWSPTYIKWINGKEINIK